MSNNMNTANTEKSKSSFWIFLIPSLIGLFLFMAPISYEGDLTIPVAILAKSIQAVFGDVLVPAITAIVAFMALASICTKLFKPAFIQSSPFLKRPIQPISIVVSGTCYWWCSCCNDVLPSRSNGGMGREYWWTSA